MVSMKKVSSGKKMVGALICLSFLFIVIGGAQADLGLRQVGTGGIGDDGLSGDRQNSYAWCMETIRDPSGGGGEYLYVGSNRALAYLVLYEAGFTDEQIVTLFKGNIVPPTDIRARIFRYRTDGSKPWELVYTSPVETAVGMPRHLGYRVMKTYTDAGGKTALYVATTGFIPSLPVEVLRFSDDFNPAEDEPVVVFRSVSSDQENSIRSLDVHDGHLVVGMMNGDIWITDRPESQGAGLAPRPEVWKKIADRGIFTALGLPDKDEGQDADRTEPILNWQFLPFNGYLYTTTYYLNTRDTEGGFWVFKGKPQGDPLVAANWKWEKTMSNGAGNSMNEIAGLFRFGEYVYVGTLFGLPYHLADRRPDILLNRFSDPRAEIYRFDKDDQWEMIIGDPGKNSLFDGRLGNYAAGFFDPEKVTDRGRNYSLNFYVWWMEEYKGKLYCSTFDIGVFFDFLVPLIQAMIPGADEDYLERFKERIAFILEENKDNPPGADLFVSEDGVNFSPVTRDGFDDRFNYGIRTLKATEGGLMAGSANPFYGFDVYQVTESTGDSGGSTCFLSTLLK